MSHAVKIKTAHSAPVLSNTAPQWKNKTSSTAEKTKGPRTARQDQTKHAAERADAEGSSKKKETDDIASLFSALKNNNSGPLPRSASAASGRVEDAPAAPGDGLYRAPDVSVSIDDEEFFGSALRKRKRARDVGTPSATQTSSDPWCSRIISRKELSKMQAGGKKRNPNAGNTPNCPFDCDCCF
jgi:hypothetical protein